MLPLRYSSLVFMLGFMLSAHASIYGGVQGVVHDPQHRPLTDAVITLQPAGIQIVQTSRSAPDGTFHFAAVPLGNYILSVSRPGFMQQVQYVTIQPGTTPVLHFELLLEGVTQEMNVSAAAVNTASATPTTTVTARQIANTPGADQTGSLALITEFVPGAYITHDQLHIRGGHQVSWLIDGVEIPNTNIASNLGPQIDPKDIDTLQTSRGSYSADLGDRTYGVFDIAPKSGFSRYRNAELVLTSGSFAQTDDQLSFGSHTSRFAYYGSFEGNRSGYGLSAPIGKVLHDARSGFGGFTSLLFNQSARNQLRFAGQLRHDFFQIPYNPDSGSIENQVYDSSHLRDAQNEADGFAAFTWAHISTSTLLQVSPFFHHNSANFTPNSADQPIATISDRSSDYGGLQASLGVEVKQNNLQGGFYSFGQHDSNLFANNFNDGSFASFTLSEITNGGLVEEWVSDSYRIVSGITVTGGLRASQFRADVTENYAAPRIGLALEVPRLHWVFRGFYGRFYQPPPLLTVGGPLVTYAESQNTTLQPLHGERDEEHQFGVQIPLRGWVFDVDTFKTRANNFLDHSNIGESSTYLPVTIDGALVQAWEATLRSPMLPHSGQAHLAYSNQLARQRGAVNGGLVCFPVASAQCDIDPGYTPLDHDQRNTLNVGYSSALPLHAFASTNVYYGSGFTNGSPSARYPGNYLPQHTTFDLALSKSFGEKATVSVTATNVGNRHLLLDNSLTFGGFHTSDPRQIYGELRYRFHY